MNILLNPVQKLTVFSILLIFINSTYCVAQDYKDYIYIKRYDISVNHQNSDFEYIDKIDGLGILHKGAILNILGRNSPEIIDMIGKAKEEGVLDSIYLDTYNAYLYKSIKKEGIPKPKYFYVGQIILPRDTLSFFAFQNEDDKQVEQEIIQIINSAKVGDVKGDMYYFKDFEFTRTTYLRKCLNCRKTIGIILTNNGRKNGKDVNRAMLHVDYIDTSLSINNYIKSEREIRRMEVKDSIITNEGLVWVLILTNNVEYPDEQEYEYLLQSNNRIYRARFSGPWNVKFRRTEIDNFLQSFRLKH